MVKLTETARANWYSWGQNNAEAGGCVDPDHCCAHHNGDPEAKAEAWAEWNAGRADYTTKKPAAAQNDGPSAAMSAMMREENERRGPAKTEVLLVNSGTAFDFNSPYGAAPQVGDINSDARGSGARFNAGKTKLEYVPMRVLLDVYKGCVTEQLFCVATSVADFEEGDDLCAKEALSRLLQDGFLADTCAQFHLGATLKYKAWNWAKGMSWSVPLACTKRHWLALARGEKVDIWYDEAGKEIARGTHWGAIGCNLVMLVHYVRYYREGDDRPPAAIFGKEND